MILPAWQGAVCESAVYGLGGGKWVVRSGGEQVDDFLDGYIGAVVGLFQSGWGLMVGGGAMMEAAVGQRTSKAFVDKQE
jgi:hypothetical protein